MLQEVRPEKPPRSFWGGNNDELSYFDVYGRGFSQKIWGGGRARRNTTGWGKSGPQILKGPKRLNRGNLPPGPSFSPRFSRWDFSLFPPLNAISTKKSIGVMIRGKGVPSPKEPISKPPKGAREEAKKKFQFGDP